MIGHLRECYPEEGCGFAAGRDVRVTEIIPITNSLHSQTRYLMDPQGQIDAHVKMEDDGLDLLAVFHSHPESAPYPSPTDLAELAYPHAYMLIVGFLGQGTKIGLFKIENGRIIESMLRVV